LKRILPPTIQAGVTLDRSVTRQDYPAPEWALNVYLRGPSTINLAGAQDGVGFRITKNAETTGAWVAGIYAYVARATRTADGAVEQLEDGQVEILADMTAVADGTDLRSDAEKVLDSIEAVIAKRATRDQERYKINERELWRTPIQELLRLRNVYRVEVRRERAKARGMSLWGPALRVRM
jgi:hypothetical protein